jgi:hypothetical protein
MFEVGQKVVCIDDNWVPDSGDASLVVKYKLTFPKKDEVYTIRRFVTYEDGLWILLEEIHNPKIYVPGLRSEQEPCFAATCFRPLVEDKKEDPIAIFRKIDADVFAKKPEPVTMRNGDTLDFTWTISDSEVLNCCRCVLTPKKPWGLAALLVALALSFSASAADLPTPSLTPGVALSGVSAEQVCKPGYAGSVRNVPSAEKNKVYKEYGIARRQPGEYEVDHLISLELGGSNEITNLWPQNYKTAPWNAHVKDRLENHLHSLVCAGSMTLEEAQRLISTDWIAAYRTLLGNP